MTTSYRRIAPLPEDHAALASGELTTLSKLWKAQQAALVSDGRLQPFLQRLKREWAIETGLIERLYTWDRGITETLIEQGVDAALITSRTGYDRRKAENVRDLILDQESVIDGLFELVKNPNPLSEYDIRSLHQALTVHQETTEAFSALQGSVVEVALLRGEYKRLPNNPTRPDGSVHPYCPPELVHDEMQALLGYCVGLPDSVAPEVSSAWLHHRFAQIHPFQDGNGRVARSLASLVLIKEGLFPLVLRDADRMAYIDALEAADAGDLAPLVSLFASRQRDVILGALSADRAVEKSAASTRAAIKRHALAKLEERQTQHESTLRRVFETASTLRDLAFTTFTAEARELDGELRDLVVVPGEVPYNAESKQSTPETRAFYRSQILAMAKAHGGYFANFETVHHWVRLSMQTGPIFELVISIHGVGRDFNGVLVATAFTDSKYRQEERGPFVFTGVAPACTEAFQFNYLEADDTVRARFTTWLDEVVTIGLAAWQRSLDG